MTFFIMRDKTEVVFRIREMIGNPVYSVWDNSARKFIRTGIMKDIEGNDVNVEDSKFIKREDFKKLFPNMNKNNKVRWKVVIDEEEFDWEMPITADRFLNGCIANVQAMGQKPLLVEYKLTKTGEKLATRYKVVINNTEDISERIKIRLNIDEEQVKEGIALTDTEKKIVTAIKEQGINLTFEQVKDTFLTYNVQEDRAKQIFEQEIEIK